MVEAIAGGDEQALRSFIASLDLVPGVVLPTPDDLTNYLFAALNPRYRFYDVSQWSSADWGLLRAREGPYAKFAEDVVQRATIPFESSPLGGSSVAELAKHGVAITAGAAWQPAMGEPSSIGGFFLGGFAGLFLVYVVAPLMQATGQIAAYKVYELFRLTSLLPGLDPETRRFLIERDERERRGEAPGEDG